MEKEAEMKKTVSLPPKLVAQIERAFCGPGQPLNWHRFLLYAVEEVLANKTKTK